VTGFRVRVDDGRVRFSVRVQPRASRSEVIGVRGDELKVRLAAPPVDGAANDALIELLAKAFAVRRGAIRILAGHGSRSKFIEVEGITERAVNELAIRSGR
jgi:uncharacterized protein